MSAFTLRLHPESAILPIDEPLDALDEAEARELAKVRLLLTREYRLIELRRGDQHLDAFERDSAA